MKLFINDQYVATLETRAIKNNGCTEGRIIFPLEICIVTEPDDDNAIDITHELANAMMPEATALRFDGDAGTYWAIYDGEDTKWRVQAADSENAYRQNLTQEEAVEQAYAASWQGIQNVS